LTRLDKTWFRTASWAPYW